MQISGRSHAGQRATPCDHGSTVTTAPSSAPKRPWLAVCAALLACLGAVFLLPYFVPVRPSSSISAMAGFSNTAALILLPLCAAAFGWYLRGFDLTFSLPARTLADRRSRLLLTLVCLAIAVVCTLLWLAQRGKGGAGELTFFGPLYENFRLGQRFYRDLDFPYGPLLAYSPVIAAKLSGLSLFDGYHLAWLLQSVLGVYLIFQTVSLLGVATTPRARVLFLLLAVFFYVQLYSEGIQYTPVRFFLAPLLALCVDRLYRRGVPPWKVFLLAAVGNAVILFYSPEHGIQFFVGTLIFFVLCVGRACRPGTWPALALFAGIFAVAIAIAASMGVLGFFFHSSGGALNLPLLLGPPTLAAVFFVLAAGVTVAAAQAQHWLNHPWVYLIALSTVTLLVALSRCDPGHLFVNLLGAFLAVFAVLSARRGWFAAVCVAFCCIVGRDVRITTTKVLPSVARDGLRQAVTEPTPLHSLARRYQAYLVRRNGLAGAAAMQREHQLTAAVQPGTPLPAGTEFFAPFGAPYTLPRPAGDPHIFTGSYPGATIYATYAEAEKKHALSSRPDRLALLPNGFERQCTINSTEIAGIRANLGWIFQTPLVPRLHSTGSPWQPFCTWVARHYTVTDYASPLPNMRVYRQTAP